MPGNEKSSFPGGSVGATDMGETPASAGKAGTGPGTSAVAVVPEVLPGTSAVSPASDAAIARRSASFNGPGRGYSGDAGTLGGDSTADISLAESGSSNIVTGISSDSASAVGAGVATRSPFPRSRGIARKNSFASLSSCAGSGNGIVPKG